jgi:TonB family protein
MTLHSIGAACLVLALSASLAEAQTGQTVYKPGEGITPPQLVKEVKPEYPPEAREAKIQGIVELECVVQTDGVPRDVQVKRPANVMLDEAAIETVRQWRFKPGTKAGEAVPVLVTIEISFTLRDRPAGNDSARSTSARSSAPSAQRVYAVDEVNKRPVVVRRVIPKYTQEARDARISGTVELECVVLEDGTVGDVKVTESLDPGLDEQAVKAAKEWTFEPALKDGQPVAVRVAIEMTFTLK